MDTHMMYICGTWRIEQKEWLTSKNNQEINTNSPVPSVIVKYRHIYKQPSASWIQNEQVLYDKEYQEILGNRRVEWLAFLSCLFQWEYIWPVMPNIQPPPQQRKKILTSFNLKGNWYHQVILPFIIQGIFFYTNSEF